MTDEQNNQSTSNEGDDQKTFKCAKCGKEKDKSHGSFVYGGTTFCCEECCKKDGEKSDSTCEFC